MKGPHRSVLAAMLLIVGAAKAYAQCGTCQPQMKANWPTPNYSVFLDGLPAAAQQAAINGMNMWNAWFTSHGQGAPFALVAYGPGTIEVRIDPSLSGTYYGAVNTGGSLIGVNPDYASNSQAFLTQIFGHEFGHSVGFTDVDAATLTNCAGQTMMYNAISPNASQYLNSLTSADTCALATDYPPPAPPPPSGTPQTCNNSTDGTCESPIVINLGNGDYALSGADDPVSFDLDADGARERITWTAPSAPMAFLALDRNGNGIVDDGSELFGNHTPLPTGGTAAGGFAALAAFDANGDGVIDSADPVWPQLLLWVDANHDGVCQPEEVTRLAMSGITALAWAAHWTGRRDANGNVFRYEAIYYRGSIARPYYDIYFLRLP